MVMARFLAVASPSLQRADVGACLGTSEHAIPANIVMLHTGKLLDCGGDAPVLLAAELKRGAAPR